MIGAEARLAEAERRQRVRATSQREEPMRADARHLRELLMTAEPRPSRQSALASTVTHRTHASPQPGG